MTLTGVAGSQLLVLPSIAISGLTAHAMAEALLNAPRLLGSLELLGNPAGLVNSLAEGLQDFLSLSLTARSPSTLILGVGAGGASLVKHVGGWTLHSIAGFSSAFSRNLERSLEFKLPKRLAGADSRAIFSTAPVGATSKQRPRLLAAIGAPVISALSTLGSFSSGLASQTGLEHGPALLSSSAPPHPPGQPASPRRIKCTLILSDANILTITREALVIQACLVELLLVHAALAPDAIHSLSCCKLT